MITAGYCSKDSEAAMLRLSSTPFTIHLDDEPYILTKTAIEDQLDTDIQRSKENFFPTIKLLSQSGTTLLLQLTDQKIVQQMTVMIEPDKIQVSCNCNSKVKTVCIHVYRALCKLLLSSSTDYFEQHSPAGIATIAKKHSKYFDRHVHAETVYYSAKKQGADIYRFSHSGLYWLNEDHFTLPAATPKPMRTKKIFFILLTSYRRQRFPAIVPCAGVLSRDGDSIKKFLPFLSGTSREEGLLTADQFQLMRTGLSMWKLAEKMPGSFKEMDAAQQALIPQIFALWEEALPVLAQQQSLYSYRLAKIRDLKQPPQRKYMHVCRISVERPVLSFVLKDCGAYYLFYPELSIRDKKYSDFRSEDPFMICIADTYYLLSCVRDAAMIELVTQKIIFKEQYEHFSKNLLALISAHYPVNRITHKTKKHSAC